MYIFDQKLRLLLADILERIEKTFKTKIINELSVKESNVNWFTDVAYFANSEHGSKITDILSNLRTSKEIYIKHFYKKYTESECPPAWMIMESLTFGQTVLVYRKLTIENKALVARTYVLNKKFIESWFYAFSDIRNICAHHGRLWNREMRVKPTQKYPKYKDLFYSTNGNRLFNHILLMYTVNHNFTSASEWLDRLSSIIEEHSIEVSHMGFQKIGEIG